MLLHTTRIRISTCIYILYINLCVCKTLEEKRTYTNISIGYGLLLNSRNAHLFQISDINFNSFREWRKLDLYNFQFENGFRLKILFNFRKRRYFHFLTNFWAKMHFINLLVKIYNSFLHKMHFNYRIFSLKIEFKWKLKLFSILEIYVIHNLL